MIQYWHFLNIGSLFSIQIQTKKDCKSVKRFDLHQHCILFAALVTLGRSLFELLLLAECSNKSDPGRVLHCRLSPVRHIFSFKL